MELSHIIKSSIRKHITMKINYKEKNCSRSLFNINNRKFFLSVAAFCIGQICLVANVSAQTYNISTVAGGGIGDGYAATSAVLLYPQGVAVDGSGNVYIADCSNNRIRKVSTSGIITTIAGTGVQGSGGDGGAATAAQLNNPYGVAVDATGNVYIADTYNYKIREVNTSGIISTIAGNGTDGYTGNGGPATAAEFGNIYGIAVSSSGNIYVPDQNYNVVRLFKVGGNVSVFAGNGTLGFSGDGNSATGAELYYPIEVAVDNSNNVYIADAGNNRVRKVSTSNVITTFAGNGNSTYSGDGGAATAAGVYYPWGVSTDAAGNVYISDSRDNRIREVNTSGTISTIAGNGTLGFTGDGGPATAAELNSPSGIAVVSTGAIMYIVDNYRIRQVNGSTISTYAGGGIGDSEPATAAELNIAPPSGNSSYTVSEIATDATGNMYIADFNNNRIRKISSTGIISTVAGNGTVGYSGDGGNAIAAELNVPRGVAVDATGNVYIADTKNSAIRKINTSGIISTIAGNGTAGYSGDGSAATAAELNFPTGITLDPSGNVYIADLKNQRIREVNTSGIISTIAGTGAAGFSGDGFAATTAELDYPSQLTMDATGYLYIADLYNNRVRIMKPGGNISTFAGNGTAAYKGDGGPATAAELYGPVGVMAYNGDIYIADYNNNRVRRVNASGTISTIAGDFNAGFMGDGGPATAASLSAPSMLTVDGSGNIYMADNANGRIRELKNSCTMTASSKANPPSCNGGSDGNATASPIGGNPGFTYLWAPGGATTATISKLTAGTYTCTITDTNGCTATAIANVPSPPAIRDSASQLANASCYGASNGYAVIGIKYGTAPYTYLWSPFGGTSDTATGLTAGTYTETVTDSHGCTSSVTVTIGQPSLLTATATSTNASCGTTNGAATATVAGGTAPYNYSWNTIPVQNASTATGLGAGNYTVTVTDGNGCTANATTTVTASGGPVINPTITNSSCKTSNGKAKVTITGGTAPYRYSWNNGDTLATDSNMAAGSYIITVTDANGCSNFEAVNINDASGPVISSSKVTNVTCNGDTNGAITITVTGGTAPYQYSWSNFATKASISGLSAGPYQIMVTDAGGCVAAQTINVNQPNLLSLTTSPTPAGCGKSDGGASVNIFGGVKPFNYKWSTGNTTSSISNVAAGSYTVTVSDSNGCSTAITASVTNPSGPVVTMDSVIDMNCAAETMGSITTGVVSSTLAYSCLWSNGDTAQNIYNLSGGNYSIVVTDGVGCLGTANANITTALPPGISICMVTVNPANNLNTLLWDSNAAPGRIAKYVIYKETTTPGVFGIIGTAKGTAGSFLDTASNSGKRSWAYEIAELDSCGQSSPISQSILFKTIHLTATVTVSNKVNLVWDDFEGASFSHYIIYRDSVPGIAKDSIASVSNNTYGYTDAPPTTYKNWYYHIGIGGTLGCTSLRPYHNVESINYNASKSNTGPITITGVGMATISSISGLNIYPNPSRGIFNMDLYLNRQQNVDVIIYTELGQVIEEESYGTQTGKVTKQYNLSNYTKGVYFIKVATGDRVEYRKVVIE